MIQKTKLSDIHPYERNPRRNDNAVEAVAESIRQCGYIAPIIVDEDGVILAGHTRYKALKKLGYREADVFVKSGMTEEQKKKYRILDNKTNEFAEWDFDLLQTELEDIDFDGFDFNFELPEPFDETGLDGDEIPAEIFALTVKFENEKDYNKAKDEIQVIADKYAARVSVKME